MEQMMTWKKKKKMESTGSEKCVSFTFGYLEIDDESNSTWRDDGLHRRTSF
jgi:hypothetical protein